MRGAAIVCALLVMACSEAGGDMTASPPAIAALPSCSDGTQPFALGCVRCAPPERELDDGSCRAPGIPADGCSEGFVHDGVDACEPVLPSAPCRDGMIAVPGDAECRPVGACGAAPWGDIPLGPTTVHVDIGYAGTDSDGSAAKPWRSLAEGIVYAEDGDTVAVAAGSYAEDVVVIGENVTLWGRCPELVEIVGQGSNPLGTVLVAVSGGATIAVKGVAVRGPIDGVTVVADGGLVELSELWIHDNGESGIVVLPTSNATVPSEVHVRDSLVERSVALGFSSVNVAIDIDGVEVRDAGEAGVVLHVDPQDPLTPHAQVQRAHIHDNATIGLMVRGEASASALVVRDTRATADESSGLGVGVWQPEDNPAAGALTIAGSIIERSERAGLVASGASLEVLRSVIRDSGHRAIQIETDEMGKPVSFALVESLLLRNTFAGVLAFGATSRIESSVVAETRPSPDAIGVGVVSAPRPGAGSVTDLEMAHTALDDNTAVGLFVIGSPATVHDTVVRRTRVDDGDVLGAGSAIYVAALEDGTRASLTLRRSRVADSQLAGISVFGASLDMADCELRNTTSSPSDLVGDALAIMSLWAPADAVVADTLIDRSARAALAVFGADLDLSNNRLICQQLDINAETHEGRPYTVHDSGENACGCPDPIAGKCRLVSSGLAPPKPLPPL